MLYFVAHCRAYDQVPEGHFLAWPSESPGLSPIGPAGSNDLETGVASELHVRLTVMMNFIHITVKLHS